jgi:hypothetical protein
MAESALVPAPQGRIGSASGAIVPFVGALALLAVIVALGLTLRTPSAPAGGPIPLSPAVETKWGVRVSQVAVTADGGLVDFRFIILDPDKASEMLSNVDNLPVLRVDSSGTLVNSTAQMGGHPSLRAGQTYFLLYRNTGGSLHSGSSLSVLFGDLSINNVIAR